jgi:hypothetical protein
VFGPVSIPSFRKYVYYISFIDDFSRNTWIYLLGKKSEVFDMFKEFKALIENQTEKIIKVLTTNNGEEFCGFLGLGFHGKNICVMFVFSIVYFMFFY